MFHVGRNVMWLVHGWTGTSYDEWTKFFLINFEVLLDKRLRSKELTKSLLKTKDKIKISQ
jgi:hypothetical protein